MTNDTKKDLLEFAIQNSQITQNPMNDKLFLNKKRLIENSMLLQDINHYSISNSQNLQFNDFKGNDRGLFGFNSQMIRHEPELIYNNNSNLYTIQLNNYSPIFLNSIGTENKLNNYYNYIYNLNYSLIGNEFNHSIYNKYKKEKNIKNINYSINDITNYNVNDKSKVTSTNTNFVDKKSFKSTKIFKVIYNKKKEPIKKKKNNLNHIENNNEIKVYKNKKVVYVNASLLNSYSTAKNIKQLNKIYFIKRNRSKRGSIYRGVSKNGNQWQVLMKENKNKIYKGSYPSEELAARIYDVLAFKNKGLKARTNFIYTSNQIKKICETEIDITDKDIYDIIKQLII